ncbi:SPFH domain-containing protein (plasmid) [Qipengyuania citrea]|jgi:regulator of protease activity HflC (stomatin/prohibitin superfamily)|uniref:SPFH domain-containing protein n=1 Tax=Qipengyuania citrea TaxID=225971 RepID=A0ABY4UEJ4_9SPHN|nr:MULTISPECIES: SPFH domain-containing protein [Erythrobacteraceae]MCH2497068.1 SPFH domain-containing protein [Erythrobacter sp.]MEC7889595.1 SPFH domain-containing protein [Pseudomonadota bacterium]MEC7953890.1 SPFH domain-containing protein [Pseudomonadota bacterium]MEE2795042.1 SPFH domain-containing protein [Pseudomonadota bacterium]USA63110.1 SPFH domain-containing protein [Qipengyuania citrea]|tara:strand:- start:258 stop:1172 length:915 start_codon:yes stop_codon:yes gene_type:complete
MSVEFKGMNTSTERAGSSFSGYPMLLFILALLVLVVWNVAGNIPPDGAAKAVKLTFVGLIIFPLLVLAFLAAGFFMIQPNQATVITLFGEYRGTERREGLRWVWPWMMKNKMSVRAHNIHSERVKINDLRGNPIEIACNVVWRVADTAQASFDVDDYKEFVNIQIEAGLRTVGSRHPYDDFENEEVTLRGSADVINRELLEELNDRLKVAGILVDEAGLTHLAYASEIASAMLKRQQADAIIAARAKIVLGAVGMVEDALIKLSQDNIVEMDDERRAAMVSNLMVVLCGEKEAHPVVNAGTLYQ